MLEVRNLVKSYKTTKSKTKDRVVALNNVSITFPETGLVFLLGKSGSGKSTLLNAIGGLDSFDSGEIIIKGKSSRDFSQSDFDSYRNTFIGFIFQEYNVLEEFTVAKNLSMALELQGKKADKEEVNKLLEQVEMLEYSKRKPNQLSGGQKQRVAIARALIKNPEIIMADEPTGALDSNTGKQVMETLKKLSKEKLVIIVSHDREFAEIYGDRIIELKDGKIISDVTKKEVEPIRTESGISLIDDKIIHIKKGTNISNTDMQAIAKAIAEGNRSTDVIISIDEKSVDEMKKISSITDEGNREVFAGTEKEDIKVKEYNPKDFKLIRSRLHFKDSFKMGASALKSKVAKLVFTIILSFISFAMFGLVDTLAAFNRPDAVYTTIEMTGTKQVSMLKETKGKWDNYAQPVNDKDIAELSEKYEGISFQPVVNKGVNFGSYNSSSGKKLIVKDLDSSSNHTAYEPNYSGIIDISQEKLDKLGFNLTGSLPAENDPQGYTQICISKHLYECYKYNNAEDITDEQDFLQNHNLCNLQNNNGENQSSYQYKIVGIIDSHEDLSEFYNIEEEQMESMSMNSMMLQQKIKSSLAYGYSGMIYSTKEHFDTYLEKTLEVRGAFHYNNENKTTREATLNNFIIGTNLRTNYYKNLSNSTYDDFNNRFTIKGNGQLYTKNSGSYQLADDEIIVGSEFLYYINYNYDFTLQDNIVLKLRTSYNPNSNVEKTFKVVGYSDHSALDIIVNDNIKADLTGNEYYLFTEEGTNYLWTSFSKDSIHTPESKFKSNYSYSPDVYYYNGNDYFEEQGQYSYTTNFDGDLNLTGNQIILPYDYFYMSYSYDPNETTKDRYDSAVNVIKNGYTITLKTGYDDEAKTICEFEVVGLSLYSTYISEEYYNNFIKDRISGYDYIIATLSDNESVNKSFIKECETFNSDEIKFTVQNGSTSILDSWGSTFEDITSILIWVALGFAVFASLMLMSFISTSISYKKREIGILRALGARSSDVFGIFFKESLIIALINFALAFTTTVVGAFFINRAMIVELGIDLALLTVSIRQFALILGISILAAFIASILPVSKISRKKPIDAINNR